MKLNRTNFIKTGAVLMILSILSGWLGCFVPIGFGAACAVQTVILFFCGLISLACANDAEDRS